MFNSIKQEYEPSGFTPFAFPPGTDLNAANSSGWIDIQPTIDAITNIDSTHLWIDGTNMMNANLNINGFDLVNSDKIIGLSSVAI